MNAKLLKLLGNRPECYPHQLAERFPHIVDAILLLWGEPEMEMYFNRLMINDRKHIRQGFPPAVGKEIHALRVLHETMFPRDLIQCVWERAPQR